MSSAAIQTPSPAFSPTYEGAGPKVIVAQRRDISPAHPTDHVFDLVLSTHYVAWTSERQIEVFDLDNDTERTVATAAVTDSYLGFPLVSRDILVYGEIAHRPKSPTDCTPFRLLAIDLKNGESHVIADVKAPICPGLLGAPAFEWPWLVWTEQMPTAFPPSYEHPPIGDTIAYDMRDGSRRVILHDNWPQYRTLAQGLFVYDRVRSRAAARPNNPGRDVWVVPVDGSKPATQITSIGTVGIEHAAFGKVAWARHTEGLDAAWFAPIDGGASPVQFADSNQGFIKLGRNFVAWADSHQNLVARPLTPIGATTTIELWPHAVPAAWWCADGDRLVWDTADHAGAPNAIHVATMTIV